MAARTSSKKGALLAIIGDEVEFCNDLFRLICVQDTVTGFLLGGIGEMNSKREGNYLVVNKGEGLVHHNPTIAKTIIKMLSVFWVYDGDLLTVFGIHP